MLELDGDFGIHLTAKLRPASSRAMGVLAVKEESSVRVLPRPRAATVTSGMLMLPGTPHAEYPPGAPIRDLAKNRDTGSG